MARWTFVLLLACVAVAAAVIEEYRINSTAFSMFGDRERRLIVEAQRSFDPEGEEYASDQEWEGYDGWYNNPAHPEWGGAGMFVSRAAAIIMISLTHCCYLPRFADGKEDTSCLPGRSVRDCW